MSTWVTLVTTVSSPARSLRPAARNDQYLAASPNARARPRRPTGGDWRRCPGSPCAALGSRILRQAATPVPRAVAFGSAACRWAVRLVLAGLDVGDEGVV